MSEALKSLLTGQNPNELDIDANGGTIADTPVAYAEHGKVVQYRLSELGK